MRAASRADRLRGLGVEIWDVADLPGRIEKTFGCGIADLSRASPRDARFAIQRAHWRLAFDGKFDKDCLAAPANQAFTIDFDNLDRGIPHNVAIYQDDTASKTFFKGELVDGPGKTTYSVPALPEGRFFFRCDPHPDMHGTFIVGNPPPS